MIPPGIEPGYQVPETCALSIVLRDHCFRLRENRQLTLVIKMTASETKIENFKISNENDRLFRTDL